MLMSLNVQQIRNDFPILDREVRPGVKVVYLNSTATSQKPESVIEAMNVFYRRSNANIHRGVHTLAEEATAMYEQARREDCKIYQRAVGSSNHLHSQHNRVYKSCCLYLGARKSQSGRFGYFDRDGTSQQPGSVAYPCGGTRRSNSNSFR